MIQRLRHLSALQNCIRTVNGTHRLLILDSHTMNIPGIFVQYSGLVRTGGWIELCATSSYKDGRQFSSASLSGTGSGNFHLPSAHNTHGSESLCRKASGPCLPCENLTGWMQTAWRVLDSHYSRLRIDSRQYPPHRPRSPLDRDSQGLNSQRSYLTVQNTHGTRTRQRRSHAVVPPENDRNSISSPCAHGYRLEPGVSVDLRQISPNIGVRPAALIFRLRDSVLKRLAAQRRPSFRS